MKTLLVLFALAFGSSHALASNIELGDFLNCSLKHNGQIVALFKYNPASENLEAEKAGCAFSVIPMKVDNVLKASLYAYKPDGKFEMQTAVIEINTDPKYSGFLGMVILDDDRFSVFCRPKN